MRRLRVQVQVMPWENPGPLLNGAQTRRDEVVKMLVPCDESLTLQELADKIVDKWANMYIGKGALNIRYIATPHGEKLDMKDLVGDIFDDRPPNGDVPNNSIAQVYRYRPDPSELQEPQRYGSLMPESSARPRKRPLGFYSSVLLPGIHEAANAESWNGGRKDEGLDENKKRPKATTAHIDEIHNPDQPILSREKGESIQHQRSLVNGSLVSVHQVPDSQKSPPRRSLNPYGTPTSLSFNKSQIEITTIPDSPNEKGRTLGESTREYTKSESPELRLSVHEVPARYPPTAIAQHACDLARDSRLQSPLHGMDPRDPASAQFDYTTLSHRTSGSSQDIVLDSSPILPTPKQGIVDRAVGVKDAFIPRTTVNVTNMSPPPPMRKRNHSSINHKSTGPQGNARDTQRKADDIYDPIETDNESFQEKQRMHSSKRLKLDRSTPGSAISTNTISVVNRNVGNGNFLVPALPSVWKNKSPNQTNRTQQPLYDDNTTLAHEVRLADPTPTYSTRPTSQQYLSQDSINWSQNSLNPDKTLDDDVNYSETRPLVSTFEEKQNESAARQERTPERGLTNEALEGKREAEKKAQTLELAVQQEATERRIEAERLDQEEKANGEKEQAERLAQEEKANHEERQAEEAARQQILEEEHKKAHDREIQARELAEELRLMEEMEAEEEKRRAEALAAAQETKKSREKAGDLKQALDKNARERKTVERKNAAEKLALEPRAKDLALSKQAEKAMRTAEGARQLEAEKFERKKARRRELVAGKKADDQEAGALNEGKEQSQEQARKARKEQKAYETARLLAASTSRDDEELACKAETEKEKENSKAIIRRIRAISESRSHASSTPGPADRAARKRTMTPAIPSPTSVKQPSSVLKHPVSSSPLSLNPGAKSEAPLRSALRHTPSSVSRSVSFLDEAAPKRNLSPTPNASTFLQELPAQPKHEKALAQSPSSSKTKVLLSVKSDDNEMARTPIVKKQKVQTKLKVTRDKKMKGRVVEQLKTPSKPPPHLKTALSPTIEISSASYSSDAAEGKPGPSSRKRIPRVVPSYDRISVKNDDDIPIDPALQNTKFSSRQTATASPALRPASSLKAGSQQRSISRSPAQIMSETNSTSSASGSSSQSQSGSNAGSVSDSDTSPAVGIESPITKRTLSSNALPDEKSLPAARSVRDSAKNHMDRNVSPMNPRSSTKKLTPIRSDSPSAAAKGVTRKHSQSVSRSGRRPNGVRPADYKYPRLTQIMGQSPSPPPKNPISKIPAGKPNKSIMDNESSSDDDSSSESENQDRAVENGQASPTSKKNRTSPWRNLLKLFDG